MHLCVVVFARAIHSLSKIGDEVYIEALSDGVRKFMFSTILIEKGLKIMTCFNYYKIFSESLHHFYLFSTSTKCFGIRFFVYECFKLSKMFMPNQHGSKLFMSSGCNSSVVCACQQPCQ